MARTLLVYKTYNFRDKDPVIDEMRTIVADEGLKYEQIHSLSGVSTTTMHGWFKGETRRPQFATIMAVARACGYDLKLVKGTGGSKMTVIGPSHETRHGVRRPGGRALRGAAAGSKTKRANGANGHHADSRRGGGSARAAP